MHDRRRVRTGDLTFGFLAYPVPQRGKEGVRRCTGEGYNQRWQGAEGFLSETKKIFDFRRRKNMGLIFDFRRRRVRSLPVLFTLYPYALRLLYPYIFFVYPERVILASLSEGKSTWSSMPLNLFKVTGKAKLSTPLRVPLTLPYPSTAVPCHLCYPFQGTYEGNQR